MGVRGAAIATVIARTSECLFVVTYIYKKGSPLVSPFKEMINWDKKFLNQYKITTTPIILNEVIWALGITSYSMIYGRMSIVAVAVINIVGSVERIIFSGFIGVANASAVMVGKKIGEKLEDVAIKYAYRLGWISFLLGVVGSITLVIGARWITSFYDLSDGVDRLVEYSIYVLCFFLPLKSFNTTNVAGHMASDSVGLNVIIEALEKKGLEVQKMSGIL